MTRSTRRHSIEGTTVVSCCGGSVWQVEQVGPTHVELSDRTCSWRRVIVRREYFDAEFRPQEDES